MALLLVLALAGLAAPAGPAAAPVECARPSLRLITEEGTIEISLVPEAAPQAVAAVVELARGPLYSPRLTGPPGEEVGYYDGLELDSVNPRIEVATAIRPPRDVFLLETEIDAGALGLDEERIADAAEAMDVLQRELLPVHTRHKKRGTLGPRLSAWLEAWFATRDPSFLVGVSRREINESLGHVYRRGLASLPPVRGAVALRPQSPRWSTPALSIFLTDLPERAGRWMVVGHVAAGLDVVEAISRRPLVGDRAQRLLRPVDPLTIDSAEVSCASAPPAPGSPPGGPGP